MKGGMAAVIALVAVVRVGVSAVAFVGASLPCAGARRAGRGMFIRWKSLRPLYSSQPWSSSIKVLAMTRRSQAGLQEEG